MNLKLLLSVFFISILKLNVAYSQLPGSSSSLATLPPSIKWKQINSEHFRIIFPQGFEKEANRTTNILENIYVPASQSLGASPRKFPIILQNHHAISNGFVTIGPYRSEFFTLSPQDYNSIGNDQWLEHLASHEYRHIVQFEKTITPFTKALYFLFGEYGTGFAATVTTPSWFFEGDAVGAETAMGRSGRGRMPEFLMAFKANTIEKGGFNYYKQHLKSYREFVPNHYVLGYLMTTHLKNEYGPDVWDKITHRAFHKPFIPLVFSGSIKKETGKYLIPTYNEMMEKQKKLYSEQLSKITPTTFKRINSRKKGKYTNYKYPKTLSNGKVLALKSGFSHINQFVTIDKNGIEEKLFELGVHNDPGFLSSNDSLIVWTEHEYDTRWYKRSYSVIKKYNFQTKELTRLTKKTRYTAAAISLSAKKIVAVHQSNLGENRVQILNIETGAIIKEFLNEENHFYSMPSFSDDDENIVLLKHTQEGKKIISKSIDTGLEETLLFSDKENLGNPSIFGNHLYYNSNYNGIDNIFAMDIDSKKVFQISSSKYGAFNPSISPDGKFVYYNNYSADGMDIVSSSLNQQTWTSYDDISDVSFDFHKTMVENEDIQDILYNAPDFSYEVSKYRKLARSIHPYNWGFSFVPIKNELVGLNNEYIGGFASKDALGTTITSALVKYNTNEDTWRTSFDISYQALYPIIDLSASLGSRSLTGLFQDGSTEVFNWTENSVKLGMRLPFLLTNSKYSRRLNLHVDTEYSAVSNYNVPSDNIRQQGNGNLYSLNYGANFSRLLRKSRLDLNSKWGQTLTITAKQTPFGGDYFSQLYAAESNLYFPGLFKHHSFHLRGSYQYLEGEEYQFISPIRYTRGYGYTAFQQFTNLSANYKLPLAYMDWHLGPVINLQRVYTNVFIDQGIGQLPERNKTDQFYAVGAEVSFNFNLIRYLLLFDVGFRYSYKPEVNSSRLELIIGSITL